jgi:Cu(I)/Ag(I) efflux system membrane fusion protein
MKKTFLIFACVMAVSILIVSCVKPAKDPRIDHYTCPMHHQIHADHPGNCPICGMQLVPVYAEGMEPGSSGGTQIDDAASDSSQDVSGKSVMIGAEGQRAAGVKTAVVSEREAVKTIRTFGRVAFDPDLAVAQTDYVVALNTSPELKSAARRRLKLLGMSETEIARLEKSRKTSSSLYLPDGSSPPWVYATLYEDDVPLVQPGFIAEITVPSLDDRIFTGTVMAIDPIVDAATHTLRARIELKEAGLSLKLGTSVDVVLKIPLGPKVVVPKSALIDTGARRIAYVVKDGTLFTPVNVVTGAELKDDVVVIEGLKAGDVVASRALFLVDSEAQLRGNE